MNNERLLYIALDSNDRDKNGSLSWDLSRVIDTQTGEPTNSGYKINLDHYIKWGVSYVNYIQEDGCPVFVDLKMYNGPRTMVQIARELAEQNVRHINVWASADRLIKPVAAALEDTNTELLGVTVPTHADEEYCQRHYRRSLKDAVRFLAEVSLENGCHGIILPGTTLDVVSDLKCPKVVPGIRPAWFEDTKANYQEQTVTPTEAIQNGATILVCGTPILKNPNPLEAMINIYEEMIRA